MVIAEYINNAIIMLKDHKLSLVSDVFIVDKFTQEHELPECRTNNGTIAQRTDFGDSLPASKTCLAIISSKTLEK